MKLRLRGKSMKDMSELIKRHPKVQNSRAVKNALHIRSKKVEKEIEKSYSAALFDIANILSDPMALPKGTRRSGEKTVKVHPWGVPPETISTPYYKKLEKKTILEKPILSANSFWHNSGRLSNRFSSRVGASSKDWKVKGARLSGRLRGREKMVFHVSIAQPTFYSGVMNSIVRDAFFDSTYKLPSFKYKRSSNPSLNDQLAYLETARPLVSVVMKQHGKEAFKRIKQKVVTGTL